MSRNNIFMWAYITFMILSCIVRSITEFSMWSSIVIAITISSMFFAIEDLLASICGMYRRLTEITEQGVPHIKENFQEDIAVEARIARAYEENMDLKSELSEQFPHFENLQSYNGKIEKIIADIENDITKGKRISNSCHWISIIFAYLGFLLLFATMILVSFIDISTLIQELMTVISFAIILATNQISCIASDYVRKEENELTNILRNYDEAVKGTKEMEMKVYKMIAMLRAQQTNVTQEITDNAD